MIKIDVIIRNQDIDFISVIPLKFITLLLSLLIKGPLTEVTLKQY